MKEIARVSYDEMNFLFIHEHWDIHLKGLCIHKDSICYFETVRKNNKCACIIYEISRLRKFIFLYKQKLFEYCIGYHWSYDIKTKKRKAECFKYKNPTWFFKWVFRTYYGL